MHTIYTAGYSGWTPEQLQVAVIERGATLLDIRYRALSRRPEWRREAITAWLGVLYVPMPALGNKNYKNGGPIELAAPEQSLRLIGPLLNARPIVLLCACRDWRNCHRLVAAEYLAAQLGAPVEHLEPPAREARAQQVPLC